MSDWADYCGVGNKTQKTYNFVVHDKFRIKNIFEVKSDMEVGSGKKTPKITGLASQI